MEEIYFVTGNKDKFEEVNAILEGKIKQLDIDLEEIQSDDSYKIAKKKVMEAHRISKKPVVIEDVSFYIEALNKFPGPFIKFLKSAVGAKGIYDITKRYKNKTAVARCVVAYFDGKKLYFFTGDVKGKIVSPKGKSDFGFDPIFQPDGKKETFAQMGKKKKNEISHRSIAWRKFKDSLEKAQKD